MYFPANVSESVGCIFHFANVLSIKRAFIADKARVVIPCCYMYKEIGLSLIALPRTLRERALEQSVTHTPTPHNCLLLSGVGNPP